MLPLDSAPDGSYELEPRWKREVVHWDGDRGCLLQAGRGDEPAVLHVPSPAFWDSVVPSSLRGRRAQVASRPAGHSRHRIDHVGPDGPPAERRELRR